MRRIVHTQQETAAHEFQVPISPLGGHQTYFSSIRVCRGIRGGPQCFPHVSIAQPESVHCIRSTRVRVVQTDRTTDSYFGAHL